MVVIDYDGAFTYDYEAIPSGIYVFVIIVGYTRNFYLKCTYDESELIILETDY